jgi:2-methylcitrate dehydratase PrpD
VALFPPSSLTLAGAGAHHLCMGLGSSVSLAAARGAGAGLDGEPGTLERFFLPRAGAAPDPGLLAQGIDAQGRFSRSEMLAGYLKWRPTCAHWSSLSDAMATLVQTHGPLHERAARIEITAYAAALRYNVDAPRNALAARFSGRAIAAAMLQDGRLAPDAFDDPALTSPMMRERMDRISVAHDPGCDAGYPAGRPVRLKVHMRDGAVLETAASTPRGDAGDPLSLEDVQDKAHGLLARASADPQALLSAMQAFLAGGPIADLSAALRAP